MSPLLHRLRERKLGQWALAYLAAAWLALQVAGFLATSFGWPALVVRSFTVLIGIGFVAVLIVAWYHGERGQQRVSGVELLMLATLLVIAGTTLALVRPEREAAESPEAVAERSANAPASYQASVAVLPFDNLGDASDAYFGDGVTDEIILELSKVEGLKVISRTSVVALKGSKLTLPQIADTLGVHHVVEGSVRRFGNRVRVIAQLIDPRTDTHLWSESYERELSNIFSVQEEIARAVSSALLETVHGLRARGPASTTEQTAAYEHYLKGKQLLVRRTRDGLLGAMKAFEAAIALDASYAPAYAGLAEAYNQWIPYAYRVPLDPYVALARAQLAAERAVELDPELAEGYGIRAFARLWAAGSPDSIFADFRRALELRPNSGLIRVWHAIALADHGRAAEASIEADAGTGLDPLAPGPHLGYGRVALGARHHDIALRESRRALVLEPSLSRAWRREAQVLLLLGHAPECVDVARGRSPAIVAMCLRELGRSAEAEAELALARELVRSDTASFYHFEDLAVFYARGGDVEGAITWLERLAELSPLAAGAPWLRSALTDPVVNEPRFQAAVDRLQEYVRTRVRQEIHRAKLAPPPGLAQIPQP